MATISARTFVGGWDDGHEDGWLYIAFLDQSTNRRRRKWLLTVSPRGQVSGSLHRSQTDSSDFFATRAKLPRNVTFAILAAAIRDGLITPVKSDT